MIRWARELVVDRTVLVYAPPLRDQVGPRLGPVRLFGDLDELWAFVARSGHRSEDRQDGQAPVPEPLRIRVFPQGGLTYVPG